MGGPENNDLYVLSDLHLGEGWLPAHQRYSRLETFFYDKEFRNFIHAVLADQAERREKATLILNGDVFDFLAIVRLPTESELRFSGLRLSSAEQEFGLGSTEEKAVWKLDRILKGHPTFVLALAELLAAGHFLVLVRGNHDAELFWAAVQQRLLDVIAKTAEEEGLAARGETLLTRVTFRQWFYYEPGRCYIEHGNQYEASNAMRYVLNPVLPPEYHPQRHTQLDYPMGSLFVRYLYNKMKLLDPFTTHFVTLEQYLRITTHHNFMDLLRTGTLHFPFFVNAIREARLFEEQGMAPVKALHEERMEALAARSGLGDKLYGIEKLMSRPVGTTKYNLLKEMLRPVVRGTLTFVIIALLSIVGWFTIFSVISQRTWLAEGLLGKAGLLAMFAMLTVVGLFLAFSFINRALHRRADPVAASCAERAEALARLLNVPNVSMGHTHKADLRPFTSFPGAYCNSGTWIPHPGPWDSVKPRARQFTFVSIRGITMHLLRWHDAARTWEHVTLLEDYTPTGFERLLAESEGDRSEHYPASTDG